jgi:beta-lactamase class C
VGGEEHLLLERKTQFGLAALGLLTGAVLLASTRPVATASPGVDVSKEIQRLGSISESDRRAVNYAALDSRLKRMAERPNMVGLAVGVVENGRITFLNGYGETLAGSGERVTPLTVFRWASVSKGVAGTMAAKLAEQGKLSLEAPIVNYSATLRLPGRNEYRATLGDVLSHRLGLYRNAYDDRLESGQSPALIRQTLSGLASTCPPHTCWSYQNIAFDASSEAVSKVTGKSYEKAVIDTLFKPLGMTSATISRAGLEGSASWARPHNAGRRPLETSDNYYRVPAAGGVNSNIKDMALWMIAQMGGMPSVLDKKLLDTIHAPLVETPNERRRLRKFLERLSNPTYGYGWRSYDYSGHRIVGHRGGIDGYRSLILFDPVKKSGVVALWNSSTSQPGGLEFEVMDMLYGLEFRDWMELDKPGVSTVASVPEDENSGEPGRS